MLPFLALQPAHIGLLGVLLGLGFLIGVFGHIYKSKPTIIFGIFVVGVISCYFVIFTLVPQG